MTKKIDRIGPPPEESAGEIAGVPGSDRMKIICEAQHTPEWHEAKRTRITASEAQICLMRRTSKTYRSYVHKLADAFDGVPDFEDEDLKPWHADGIYYESWARGWYAWNYDVEVKEVGFVVHEKYDWLGCSPDGVVNEEGLVEIKYRKFLHTFDKHSKVGVTNTVKAQCQTQMLVCGAQWCDYVNYWRSDEHEKEKGHCQRIYRDDAYINNTLLPAFVRTMNDVAAELGQREVYTKQQAG